MFLRETTNRFIIEKNMLTKTLAFCLLSFIGALIYIIIQMPKTLRIGINPKIEQVEGMVVNLQERLDKENAIRDIEIKRHEEFYATTYAR